MIKIVELKGSEKQIKWANDIKKEMIIGLTMIDAIEEVFKTKNNVANRYIDILNQMKKVREDILKNNSAKWFIENRFAISHFSQAGYKGEQVELDFACFLDLDDRQEYLLSIMIGAAEELYMDKNYKSYSKKDILIK